MTAGRCWPPAPSPTVSRWLWCGPSAGGAAYFALLLAVALAARGGFGFGDVKLGFLLGMVLAYRSWGVLAVGAFGAFAVGGLVALALLAHAAGEAQGRHPLRAGHGGRRRRWRWPGARPSSAGTSADHRRREVPARPALAAPERVRSLAALPPLCTLSVTHV